MLGTAQGDWNQSGGPLNVAGDIWFNGNLNISGTLTAGGKIGVAGTCCGSGSLTPTPIKGVPAQPDPYANVSPPAPNPPYATQAAACAATPMNAGVSNATRTLEPGVYATLAVSGGATLTLEPGVYTITGSLANQGGTITGDGVTLYFCANAKFDLSKNSDGVTKLSAPGGASGFLLFFDRANTRQDAIDLQNNNKGVHAELTGIIYAANARLYSTGGEAASIFNVTGDIVVGRIYWSGKHVLNVKEGSPPAPPTTGSLVVIKTLTGDAARQRGDITIDVTCAGHEVTPSTITMPAGSAPKPVQYTDIPAGTECTVAETSNGETQTVAVSVTRSPGDGKVTIAAGETATVEVTDDYTLKAQPPPDTGSLEVIKSISGEAAGSHGDIQITVSCAGHAVNPSTIEVLSGAAASPVTYTGIPAGTECTVEETANGHTRSVDVKVAESPGDGVVTIPANGTATVALANDYTFIPGKLTVKKTIIGLAAGKHGSIRIDVKCGNTQLDPIVIASDQTGTEPTTYNNIPAGTTCTVTETKDGRTSTVDVVVTASPADGIVTIPANDSATVEITNEYTPALGSLVVTKTIAGSAAGQQGAVVIGVTCDGQTLPDFVISAAAPAGTTSHTYADIRAGAICEIKETVDGRTSTVAAAVTGGGTTTVPAGAPTTVAVTDSYSTVPGTLVVNKEITGRAAGFEGAITIHVECSGGPLPDFTIPAGAQAGTTSHTYENVPQGPCTLTEPGDGHTSIVNVTVTGDKAVDVPSNGVATANLVDTFTDGTGKLKVDKVVAGPAAGSEGTVTIAVSCNGTALPDFVIPAGTPGGTRSHTYIDIPADAICTVHESENGRTSTIAVRVRDDDRMVTIPHGATATAEIRDYYTRIRGSLTVQQTVRGPRASHRGSIRIKVMCGRERLPDYVVARGKGRGTFSHTYGNLPAHANCAVTEIGTGHTATTAVTVSGSGQRARIPANRIATLGLTAVYRRGRGPRPRPPQFTG